jgi:hypothetical protein
VATGKVLSRFVDSQHTSVTYMALAPDGKTVALVGHGRQFDGHAETVYLWEVATGKVRWAFSGHWYWVDAISFSPDGRQLVSSSQDGTALVWDVTGLVSDRRGPQPLTPERLDALWAALASADAARAYQALWNLTAFPRQTVPWLRERLTPVPAVDAQHVARLIADLDSDRFAVRGKSAQDLERLGELVEPALRQVLAGNPRLEVRRRVEQVLEKLEAPATDAEQLRALRSVEVLEHVGTVQARKVLEALATGAPAARLTQEARASLDRLAKRPVNLK